MVNFTKNDIETLNNNLTKDLKMLREVYVMDYSLLMIVIKLPPKNSIEYNNLLDLQGKIQFRNRLFVSEDKSYAYILGIIDFLQKFNIKKFFENKYLSILYGEEIKYASAVDPMIYSDRIFDFAKDYIFISK